MLKGGGSYIRSSYHYVIQLPLTWSGYIWNEVGTTRNAGWNFLGSCFISLGVNYTETLHTAKQTAIWHMWLARTVTGKKLEKSRASLATLQSLPPSICQRFNYGKFIGIYSSCKVSDCFLNCSRLISLDWLLHPVEPPICWIHSMSI